MAADMPWPEMSAMTTARFSSIKSAVKKSPPISLQERFLPVTVAKYGCAPTGNTTMRKSAHAESGFAPFPRAPPRCACCVLPQMPQHRVATQENSTAVLLATLRYPSLSHLCASECRQRRGAYTHQQINYTFGEMNWIAADPGAGVVDKATRSRTVRCRSCVCVVFFFMF
jgi:hypothetical protein